MQAPAHRGVVGDGVGVGLHVTVLVLGEAQAPERAVARVPRARPPDHRLVLGARERDVGEAEVLAAFVEHGALAVRLVLLALEADVDHALVARVGVVVGDRLALVADPRRVPHERRVDDRELEALAAVDGEHLDGLGVGLQAARALLVGRVGGGVGDAAAQPARQRGGAELLVHGDRVQELGDVAQVGQPPLAVDGGQHPAREPLPQRDRLEQGGDAAHAQHPRPLVQALVHGLPVVLGGGGDLRGRPAQERRQRDRGRARGRGGPLERLEEAQPFAGGLGPEHAAGAVDDGGDADVLERVAHECGLAVGAHEDGDVPGADGDGLVALLDHRRARGQQADEVVGEVAGDGLARAPRLRVPLGGQAGPLAREDAHPQRRRHGGAGQALRAVARGGLDLAVDDAGVAEPRAAEERVVGVEQALVAAPVRLQRRARAGGLGGGEVRVDVRAAEGIDGLLGVADEHERPLAVAEGAVDDRPLDGVGVLELVDEDDLEAAAQGRHDLVAARPAAASRPGA